MANLANLTNVAISLIAFRCNVKELTSKSACVVRGQRLVWMRMRSSSTCVVVYMIRRRYQDAVYFKTEATATAATTRVYRHYKYP